MHSMLTITCKLCIPFSDNTNRGDWNDTPITKGWLLLRKKETEARKSIFKCATFFSTRFFGFLPRNPHRQLVFLLPNAFHFIFIGSDLKREFFATKYLIILKIEFAKNGDKGLWLMSWHCFISINVVNSLCTSKINVTFSQITTHGHAVAYLN